MTDSRFMWSFNMYIADWTTSRESSPHPPYVFRFIFVVVSFIHIFRMKSLLHLLSFSCLLRAASILCFWRHYANNVYRNVKIIQALSSFFLSRITSSVLVQTVLFSILFSVTLNQCSCLRVTDRILHPYEGTFYYSFIDFTFGCLDWALEENSIWIWW